MARILVVEDDVETAEHLVLSLREVGHSVDLAANGRDGLVLAGSGRFDVLIVDRKLPGLDGLSLVKAVRAAGQRTPVIFLTALSAIADRVDGLEGGGDDYLVKPFAIAELIARVQVLARRAENASLLTLADLEMDLVGRSVRRAGVPVNLLPREWRLLEFFMRNAGQVVTRAMLLERVWGFNFDPGTGVVETHVSRMRKKVDGGFAVELLHTVRGIGYCLRAPD